MVCENMIPKFRSGEVIAKPDMSSVGLIVEVYIEDTFLGTKEYTYKVKWFCGCPHPDGDGYRRHFSYIIDPFYKVLNEI